MNNLSERAEEVNAETYNQLIDLVNSQAREIRRLEAILAGASAEQLVRQMDGVTIEITGMIASKTKEPLVQLRWGASICQMSPEEAMRHVMLVVSITEAAKLEADFFRYAIDIFGGDEKKAGAFILGFRDFRLKEIAEKGASR